MNDLFIQHLSDLVEEFALEDARLDHAVAGGSSRRIRLALVRWRAAHKRVQTAVWDWSEREREYAA